jgi:flagellar M-ring protein FliF
VEALNPVLQPLQRVWRGLSRPQQIGLGLVGAALLALVAFVSTVGRGPDSAIAFSGLNNDDEAAIVQKLKDSKIPYTLEDGGTIRVPSGQVHDARLATAGMGLNGQPASGSGFELFNQPSFGQTEFTQKVNFQRALETELERSIDQMAAVDSARVHLVIPDQTLFATQQRPTTASIMLKLKPGKYLDSAQARSISNLVAGSVQGLKPQDITIVDVNGNTLTPQGSADPSAGLSGTQLNTQHTYESTIERNLQAMLDSVLGPGKASVKVSALMNWDQIEETDETYTPGDPTQTPVLNNHSITEQTNGGTSVGGVPGAASNNGASVPTYQGSTSGSGGSTNKTDTETTYQLNKTTQKTVHAPGAVTRLSVSVIVDDDPNNPNTPLLQSVQNAVNAAAGIDPTRGDVLTVSSLPFNRQQFLDDQQALKDATQKEQMTGYLHLAALAVGPLLMLGLLFFLFKRGGKKNRKVTALETAADGASDASGASAAVEMDLAAAVPVVTPRSKSAAPVGQPITEDPQKVYIREQIQTLGKTNPGTVAQLIQTWMDEDRRN